MRLLVLGGTRFAGYAVIKAALERGWEVDAFNRGVSGTPPPGTRQLHGDRTSTADLARLAAAGPWDAAIDTSGFVPRNVLATCQHLEPVVRQYVFVSSVSVYRGWPVDPLSESSEVLYCPPDAGPDYGEDIEDGPTKYGYQKSGCELAVTRFFGPARSTIFRPGVLLGPREYVGRLPWWLRRVAKGGRVLAPGTPDRPIQPVDVRDLAEFTAHSISGEITGTYNITAPEQGETFGGMLKACADATQSQAQFVWVPDLDLLDWGVRQWSELPLWRTYPGVWQVDSTLAQTAGLRCRSLSDTVSDTWVWLQSANADLDPRSNEIGISPEKEQRILSR